MRTERNESDSNYQRKIKKLQRRVRRISWFPSYQSFSEIGIKGKRDDIQRYRYIDFSRCKDKVVVDFGCNLGQTCTKVYYAGAKRIIGLDSQKDTIKMAQEIRDFLETDIEFYVVDFNHRDYKKQIREILEDDQIDISFFLSVYRTKELKDRAGLFQFIIDSTQRVIFFEGHADPGIDTDQYYINEFKRFPVDYKFFGYTQERSRPFFEVYPL